MYPCVCMCYMLFLKNNLTNYLYFYDKNCVYLNVSMRMYVYA